MSRKIKARRPLPSTANEESPVKMLAQLFQDLALALQQGQIPFTDREVDQLRGVLQSHGSRDQNGRRGSTARIVPHWDRRQRRLWLGKRLLKEYRQPAPFQTSLLDAFQTHGWEDGHAIDPLPLLPGETAAAAEQRLHDVIGNLNRSLPSGTIRFGGDGTGHGVRWHHVGREILSGGTRKTGSRISKKH
jgi:hypothetical protein